MKQKGMLNYQDKPMAVFVPKLVRLNKSERKLYFKDRNP